MDDNTRGFRVSSASKVKRRPPVVLLAILGVVALAGVLAFLRMNKEPVVVSDPQPASAQVRPTTAPGAPTELVEQASEWVVSTGPTKTPAPAVWRPVDTPTRPPATPTPGISQCVHFKWTETQIMSPNAHVLVDISAANSCGRNLGSLELWFEVTGWRDGELVQTVRGHPFETLRHRRSANIAIGLPGSADWYDRITVKIVE